ncbi:FGGY family carbohydrate kinase, partial [Desulfobacter sp.]|uniref:FGGY family carbohydrate kinase n=1 Tax=Desulfobacter sp. TaxID=2294 RepID=UPI003D102130
MEQFIGVDQGTTATKVSCVYEDGRAQLVYQKNHRQITPEPGWVEHDGDEIYNNIAEALDKTGPGSALGIDHQGESIVAWDKNSKKCFYNVIVWQDS